ncbi:MAG TPA: Re/Si-specific NAD(P)(+) transhydrogenase subunit alpha [Caulobacteraceae bacterium]|nr:Re/Si-specific NAD(P)(+) transhydrogenase subunit alpha [Caulobacteraceae bacterium]
MAILAVTRERRAGETRVAATPESARKLAGLGLTVRIESGAGEAAAFPDADYAAAGASVGDLSSTLSDADLIFKVRAPELEEIALMKSGAWLAALLDPSREGERIAEMDRRGIKPLAMELIPRITRAQAMDALSSQANLAGYRAVIEAAEAYGRAMPMMMTAAGTIAPAKVFVMGAGVAGLQAIATARRLGAVVTATDVRPAAKEQVESLGARFVAVEDEEFRAAETEAGYAKEMSAEYQAKQAALISEHIPKQDIVITTALIPGRPAPRLVSSAQAASMRPGSVIVDLAVEQGGNVEGARPDEVVRIGEVSVVGIANMAGRIAADASTLYARNLVALAALLVGEGGTLAPKLEDEIVRAALVEPVAA